MPELTRPGSRSTLGTDGVDVPTRLIQVNAGKHWADKVLCENSVCARARRPHMPKGIARTQLISPSRRLHVAFWLFLAVVLTLAILLQLGQAVAATATVATDATYVQMSVGDLSDSDCTSHGGVIVGVHCHSASGCVAAMVNASVRLSLPISEAAVTLASSMLVFGHAPSPSFHPPKLIVQA